MGWLEPWQDSCPKCGALTYEGRFAPPMERRDMLCNVCQAHENGDHDEEPDADCALCPLD